MVQPNILFYTWMFSHNRGCPSKSHPTSAIIMLFSDKFSNKIIKGFTKPIIKFCSHVDVFEKSCEWTFTSIYLPMNSIIFIYKTIWYRKIIHFKLSKLLVNNMNVFNKWGDQSLPFAPTNNICKINKILLSTIENCYSVNF